jgi:ketosteroid isomerase-like protein
MTDTTARTVEDEIGDALADMYDAFCASDRARFDSHLAADTTTWESRLPHLYERWELDEMRDTRTQTAADTGVRIDVDMHRVDVWPEVAVARYLLQISPLDGSGERHTTRITDVFELQGDRWRIVHHHAEARPAPEDPRENER